MKPNLEKIDEAVLALLYLTRFRMGDQARAWKGQDWGVLGRLHEKGFIFDPVGKAKSVAFTEEGERRCKELFERLFCDESQGGEADGKTKAKGSGLNAKGGGR